jgi:hypothetical protein
MAFAQIYEQHLTMGDEPLGHTMPSTPMAPLRTLSAPTKYLLPPAPSSAVGLKDATSVFFPDVVPQRRDKPVFFPDVVPQTIDTS